MTPPGRVRCGSHLFLIRAGVLSDFKTKKLAFPSWLPFSLICIAGCRVWGIVQKPLTDRIEIWSIAFLQSGTTLCLALISARYRRQPLDLRQAGVHFAAAAGVLGYAATLAFLFAIQHGTTSVVVPLTAMYPVVTITLSVAIAKEKLTRSHKVGIALALAATVLL